MKPFEFKQGSMPLILSLPHSGTWMPEEIAIRLTPAGKAIKDTDWYLDRLYELNELSDASVIASNISRYVVDLNRSSDNQHLYPGQNSTGLVPVTTFDGEPIYASDPPSEEEIAQRIETWWKPYHDQLQRELNRLIDLHGFVVLWDGHSINGRLPRLFEGDLPMINFGTNQGQTCEPSLNAILERLAGTYESHSAVLDGRFIGGFITRNYGAQENVNAIQLELVRETYMFENGFTWNETEAPKIQQVISGMFQEVLHWIDERQKNG